MTRSFLFIIIAITIHIGLFMSGCTHKPDPTLVTVESIMEVHPDSALMILEGLRLPEKAPEGDRALYNLLLTQARYKNFIDEENDSLIRSSAYYFIEKGKYEEVSKAFKLVKSWILGEDFI